MVIWTSPAKADLRHIFEYIAHDSPHYARKVIQEIVAKTAVLNELPRTGRLEPELGNETVRELSVYSYRVIYELSDPDITILTIIHKRRTSSSEDIKPR